MRSKRVRLFAGSVALSAVALAGGLKAARAEPPADWFGGGQGYERGLDAAEKHGGNRLSRNISL
jgi:hypothetical protein